MLITNEKKLNDIQREFQEKFPYLKLEFYQGNHEPGKPSPVKLQLDAGKTIGQVRHVHKEGDLSIHGLMKVNTLEDHFWNDYGLNVQVFRKSGNIWLQTSITDQWTLAEQNRKGEHSVQSYKTMHEKQ
jgi:hypothetical protein